MLLGWAALCLGPVIENDCRDVTNPWYEPWYEPLVKQLRPSHPTAGCAVFVPCQGDKLYLIKLRSSTSTIEKILVLWLENRKVRFLSALNGWGRMCPQRECDW